ncbi:hypothetical protein Hanom_Chr10g00891951 [Helianthus anomalus]
MTYTPCLGNFSKKKKKKKKKKLDFSLSTLKFYLLHFNPLLDFPLSTLKFYLLHFNPFEIFTFNSNFFIFCNLTQHFIIYNFGPHTFYHLQVFRFTFRSKFCELTFRSVYVRFNVFALFSIFDKPVATRPFFIF